tara:strand:+ start:731 stop:1192 length:462 start_codon:yes stop_codon:yes gene_type:complete
MDLRTQIDEKYKTSFKSKKTEEINALRLIRSAIKDKDIENRTIGNNELINDQQIINLLQNLIKQRRDSIDFFKIASRNDLIEKEKKEIEIINQFLPVQLNEDEIRLIIEKFISDNKLTSIKEMGKIMGYLKSNYSASINMSLAGKLTKELLSN